MALFLKIKEAATDMQKSCGGKGEEEEVGGGRGGKLEMFQLSKALYTSPLNLVI